MARDGCLGFSLVLMLLGALAVGWWCERVTITEVEIEIGSHRTSAGRTGRRLRRENVDLKTENFKTKTIHLKERKIALNDGRNV